VVVVWSGLEYADSLQKSGSGVNWSIETLNRGVVVVMVVEWTRVCRMFTEEW